MSSFTWPCSCYMVLLRVYSHSKVTCQSSGAFVGVGCLKFNPFSQLRLFQKYCKAFISPGIKVILQLNRLLVATWFFDFPLLVLHTKSIALFHLWCELGGNV